MHYYYECTYVVRYDLCKNECLYIIYTDGSNQIQSNVGINSHQTRLSAYTYVFMVIRHIWEPLNDCDERVGEGWNNHFTAGKNEKTM